MTFKHFFVASCIVHAFIIVGITFLPSKGEQKKKEFWASLIAPEELKEPQQQPSMVRPTLPQKRSVPAPIRPMHKMQERPYREQVLPVPPLHRETPVVPDEKAITGSPHKREAMQQGGNGSSQEGEGRAPRGELETAAPRVSKEYSLFDRKTIDEIARKDPAMTATTLKKDNAVTFDTADYRYTGYMHQLRNKIESIWVYPPEAQVRGIYGDLKIRFTIKKDGKLGEIQLVRTSGYKMLDEAALTALKTGEPYWPLPDEWKIDSYTILGHFVYSLYGYQLK